MRIVHLHDTSSAFSFQVEDRRMPEVDQCSKCGFLAIRNNATLALHEAPEEFRETGQIPRGRQTLPFDNEPICAVGERQLHADIPQHAPPDWEGCNSSTEIIKRAIQLTRTCNSSIEWRRMLTPKEHIEMKLLEDQRAWQRKIAEEERAWREDQASKAENRHKESMSVQIRSYIVAALIGFCAAIVAVLLGFLLSR